MPMENNSPQVAFWRNPVTALSVLLVLIVGMTGVLVYCLPIVENMQNSESRKQSIFYMQPDPAPRQAVSGYASDIDIRLYWVERNLEYGNPEVALDEVKNILVLDPNNREALLLAARLYERLGKTAECVDVFLRYHGLEKSLVSAYYLAGALRADGQRDRAIELLKRARSWGEHSPLFDLRLADMLAEANDEPAALSYWRLSKVPASEVDAESCPALARLLEQAARKGEADE